ncbi:DUF6059 family protein [Streptomyces sp. NPDC048258]|uniref:DUF6059 family protein n=1 Tax=Streptomyces sp. NPDC048258 TaxID=3365527 RepID=UPI0037241AE6
MRPHRVLHAVYKMLVAAGSIWVWFPPEETSAPQGPPPRHPERLRPDLPFDETEAALFRQLMGLWQ